MKTSGETNEIAAALSKAQGQMTGAKKAKENKFFKSSYADLEAVVDAIKKPFSDNGLSYVQDIFSNDGEFISTRISHQSGQYYEFGPIRIPVKDKENPQAVKSGVTYLRRTQLLAAAGLPEEDDDGNDAAGNSEKPKSPEQKKQEWESFREGLTQETIKKSEAQVVASKYGAAGSGPEGRSAAPSNHADKAKISLKQENFLFDSLKDKNWSRPQLEQFLKEKYKVDQVPNIKWVDFNSILDHVKNNPPNVDQIPF